MLELTAEQKVLCRKLYDAQMYCEELLDELLHMREFAEAVDKGDREAAEKLVAFVEEVLGENNAIAVQRRTFLECMLPGPEPASEIVASGAFEVEFCGDEPYMYVQVGEKTDEGPVVATVRISLLGDRVAKIEAWDGDNLADDEPNEVTMVTLKPTSRSAPAEER